LNWLLGKYIATYRSLTPLLHAKNRIHFIITIHESHDRGTVKAWCRYPWLSCRNGGSTDHVRLHPKAEGASTSSISGVDPVGSSQRKQLHDFLTHSVYIPVVYHPTICSFTSYIPPALHVPHRLQVLNHDERNFRYQPAPTGPEAGMAS
jgi:hypothetical protein